MPPEFNDPKPEKIARDIYDNATNTDDIPIEEISKQIIGLYLKKHSKDDIAEIEEQLRPYVIETLKNIIADNKEDGREPIAISEVGNTVYIKVLHRQDTNFINLLNNLDPPEFEKYCICLLEMLGAKTAEVIGRTDDKGVDFIGYNLPVGTNAAIPAPKNSQITVLGQAKRRATGKLITETDIRSFIGGAVWQVYNLRGRVGALTPIVYAYWTTSNFHYKARDLAKDMGLWYLNGDDITQLSQKLGIVDPTAVMV